MRIKIISYEIVHNASYININTLKENNFKTQVGPGVYDIHSPRVPGKEEIKELLHKIIKQLDIEKLWVNPDCRLKTRNMMVLYFSRFACSTG